MKFELGEVYLHIEEGGCLKPVVLVDIINPNTYEILTHSTSGGEPQFKIVHRLAPANFRADLPPAFCEGELCLVDPESESSSKVLRLAKYVKRNSDGTHQVIVGRSQDLNRTIYEDVTVLYKFKSGRIPSCM